MKLGEKRNQRLTAGRFISMYSGEDSKPQPRFTGCRTNEYKFAKVI